MGHNNDSSQPTSISVHQHSAILYWWPVWAVGFLFAALSFVFGERVEIGGDAMWFHPSRNLGVIYITVFAVVFLRTNVVWRGTVSLLVILAAVVVVLLFSLLGWWDRLFSLVKYLSVHMDAGFYLVTSTVVFLCWALSIFVFDRVAYCEFRPGQVVLHNLTGFGRIRTYGTHGMAVYMLRDDLARHWILGWGSGDLHIAVGGAEGITLTLQNVAFVDRKLKAIEQLMSIQRTKPPEQTPPPDTAPISSGIMPGRNEASPDANDTTSGPNDADRDVSDADHR